MRISRAFIPPWSPERNRSRNALGPDIRITPRTGTLAFLSVAELHAHPVTQRSKHKACQPCTFFRSFMHDGALRKVNSDGAFGVATYDRARLPRRSAAATVLGRVIIAIACRRLGQSQRHDGPFIVGLDETDHLQHENVTLGGR
ncbi:hypothetical protein B0G69_5638 [Paraburkholderia sp. RAU2J]|nr:hypothetical protein B0G69_5638 [Paraburkholderia sp. RAU2J]